MPVVITKDSVLLSPAEIQSNPEILIVVVIISVVTVLHPVLIPDVAITKIVYMLFPDHIAEAVDDHLYTAQAVIYTCLYIICGILYLALANDFAIASQAGAPLSGLKINGLYLSGIGHVAMAVVVPGIMYKYKSKYID